MNIIRSVENSGAMQENHLTAPTWHSCQEGFTTGKKDFVKMCLFKKKKKKKKKNVPTIEFFILTA